MKETPYCSSLYKRALQQGSAFWTNTRRPYPSETTEGNTGRGVMTTSNQWHTTIYKGSIVCIYVLCSTWKNWQVFKNQECLHVIAISTAPPPFRKWKNSTRFRLTFLARRPLSAVKYGITATESFLRRIARGPWTTTADRRAYRPVSPKTKIAAFAAPGAPEKIPESMIVPAITSGNKLELQFPITVTGELV